MPTARATKRRKLESGAHEPIVPTPSALPKSSDPKPPTSMPPSSSANGGKARKRALPKEEYEEIWKEIFFAGTEWNQIQEVEAFEWDFDHLDDALTDGELAGKQVHLFGCTEPQLVHMNKDDVKGTIVPVPAIVAIECTRPPPATIGIKSVQRAEEEIIPMKNLKMSWFPYAPPRLTGSRRFKPRVHVLKCEQRRARLRNMTEAAVHKYDYVLPYLIRPDQEDDNILETDVQVLCDIEGHKAPLMMQYDFELDDLDEFIEEQIKDNELDPKKHDEVLRTAIKETVRNAKRKFKEEKAARKKRIDDIPEEDREAIRNMRLHKFYPQNDEPDLSAVKSKYINRYYGQADQVL